MRNIENSLTAQMDLFLKQKRALGFRYTPEERLLCSLAQYCSDNNPDVTTITREIADGWILGQNENLDDKIPESRITVMREFAKFLIRSGIDAYVIPAGYYTNRRNRYVPHIFNNNELKLFFKAADMTPPSRNETHCHLSVPVIFRLLYSCGFRPNEVLVIQNSDVDWDTGAIIIRKSKNHKDRRVVIDNDMLKLCKRYRTQTGKITTGNEYSFAAQNPKGHFNTSWLYNRFNEFMHRAGLTEFTGNRPRVYDFRHTFATQTLRRWISERRDLNNYLPYLSAVMGHDRLEYTQYYIHFVPEFFSESSGIDFEKFADLLPEVSDEIS